MIFNKNINFSAESANNSVISDMLFLTIIYSYKNSSKHPSEMKN